MTRPRKPEAGSGGGDLAAAEVVQQGHSFTDALLFATICIVGLRVEVQVKDGSVYSGVFHTASLDNGYGVVLKKAKKIGNGKDGSNFGLGNCVDTLVVLPRDLVQVVVKDFSVPTKGVIRVLPQSADRVASEAVSSKPCENAKEATLITLDNVGASRERIIDHEKSNEFPKDSVSSNDGGVHLVCGVNDGMKHMACDLDDASMKSLENVEKDKNEKNNPASSGKADASENLRRLSIKQRLPEERGKQSEGHEISANPDGARPSHNRHLESKLNPSAKVFHPSPNFRAPPPSVSPSYSSNTSLEAPSAVPSLFVPGYSPSCSTVISEVLPHNNSTHCGLPFHSFLPIVGQNTTRLNPVRAGGLYQSVQMIPSYMAPPSFITPSHQSILPPSQAFPGGFNPMVSQHPFSQDAMLRVPVTSQGWGCPALNMYQPDLQKLPGTPQVCVGPTVVPTGTYPLPMQGPAFIQTSPIIQPMHAPPGRAATIAKFR